MNKNYFTTLGILLIIISVAVMWYGTVHNSAEPTLNDTKPTVSTDELVETSIANYDQGYRLVEGYVVSTNDGLACIEDSTGEVWAYKCEALQADEAVLLLIGDNNTSEVGDDYIYEIWARVALA